MNDPYSVLNVPSTASDEEIKKAYRELARKYHPDNYHDNPLADLAQEKMKEINEAYDTIQKMRSGRQESRYGSSYGTSAQRSTYASGNSSYAQIRTAINMGDLNAAERMLGSIASRDGEWYFLKGSVCVRRGWLDEAHRCFETACSIAPENLEYRQALERLENSEQAYRPQGFDVYTSDCGQGNLCGRIACAYCLCNLCMGGGVCWL